MSERKGAQPPSRVRAAHRPSGYSEEIAARICELIVDSDYGVEQICEQNDDLPSARTVYRWLVEHEGFRQEYARAKEAQGHVQADRATRDAINAKDAALGRLKWDARRWQASKLAPKQYGDAVQMKHSGAVGVFDPSRLNDEQLTTLLTTLEPFAAGGSDGGGDQGGVGEEAS